MAEEVRNYQIDRKYRITFEQAASTKGVIGFKVEVNGDDREALKVEAEDMFEWAKLKAPQIDVKEK